VSKLIGLCSPLLGSGKSTLANVLVERHGFRRIPFAAVLKDMTVELLTALGYSDIRAAEVVERDKSHEIGVLDGVTARHIMQTLGTDWGRNLIHQELWVRAWQGRTAAALAAGQSVVVDDVRFPNELHAVENMGGLTVRVSRPGVIAGPEAQHASEGQLNEAMVDEVLNIPELLPDCLERVMASLADGLVAKLDDLAALREPTPVEVVIEPEDEPEPEPPAVDDEAIAEFYKNWMQQEYSMAVKPNPLTVKLVAAAINHFKGA
jgi:hypothetical protein